MNELLRTASNIGIGYFFVFSIIYFFKFLSALSLFMKYHSTSISIDIAHTIIDTMGGQTIFTITSTLAIIGLGIWFYQFKWGEQPATVS